MINKRKIVLAAILLTVNGGLFAQSVVIDQLKVSEHLYPKGFESEFQNNLDFYRDGVGVDEKAKVPYDTIRIEGTEIVKGYYTNTTEVGLYLNILTESVKAGNLQALQRIKETLTTLEQAPKWNGLFYWPYDIRDGKLVTNPDEIVPAVDNGNLSFALAGVAGAFLDSSDADKQEIVQRIEAILDGQKPGWAALYDEIKVCSPLVGRQKTMRHWATSLIARAMKAVRRWPGRCWRLKIWEPKHYRLARSVKWSSTPNAMK